MNDVGKNTYERGLIKLDKKRLIKLGIPGWLSGLEPAFGPGRDPGVPGSSPTSGSWRGACFSLLLCLCLSLFLSLSLSMSIINK